MRFSRQAIIAASAILFFLGTAAHAESASPAAERILGPHWEHLSRRAGMIFIGTLIGDGTSAAKTDRGVPSITLRFRVDCAIAGVEAGQLLSIHEWIGALSLQQPIHRGERLLLFLYPPSRLGLTSPVGGSRGQIPIHEISQEIAEQSPTASLTTQAIGSSAPLTCGSPAINDLVQSIRSARGE